MSLKGCFMSESIEWETPQWLFDELDKEFHFTLDAAASKTNAKCSRFFNKKDDALTQKWEGVVWCNPPYGKNVTGKWTEKALEENRGGQLLFYFYPQEQTQNGFIIIFIKNIKLNLLKVD